MIMFPECKYQYLCVRKAYSNSVMGRPRIWAVPARVRTPAALFRGTTVA